MPKPKYVVFTTAVNEFSDEIVHGIYDTIADANLRVYEFNEVFKYDDTFGEAYAIPVPYYRKKK